MRYSVVMVFGSCPEMVSSLALQMEPIGPHLVPGSEASTLRHKVCIPNFAEHHRRRIQLLPLICLSFGALRARKSACGRNTQI